MNRTPGNLSTALKRNSREIHVPRSIDEDLQALKALLREPTGQQSRFRLQALEFLKRLYLPLPNIANIRESSLYSWLPTVCELEGESQALDHSLLTFCVVQAAVTQTGSACVDEALQVYNDTLQKLLVEIEGFGAGRFDEILAAISVLSTSEVPFSSELSSHTISNRSSYSFAQQIMPGVLMLKEYQRFCVSKAA